MRAVHEARAARATTTRVAARFSAARASRASSNQSTPPRANQTQVSASQADSAAMSHLRQVIALQRASAIPAQLSSCVCTAHELRRYGQRRPYCKISFKFSDGSQSPPIRADHVTARDVQSLCDCPVYLCSEPMCEAPDDRARLCLLSYSFKPTESEVAFLCQSGDETCSICLESYKPNGAELAFLPCGHVAHRNCLDCWLGRAGSCPLCRDSCPHSDDPAHDALITELLRVKSQFRADADPARMAAKRRMLEQARVEEKALAERERRLAKAKADTEAAAIAQAQATAQREKDEVARIHNLMGGSSSGSPVRMLRLARSRIGPVGSGAFAQLVEANTLLETLDLAHNMLGQRDDAACVALAAALATHPSLRTLSVRANYISDTGAIALCAALAQNMTLVELDMSDNEISGEACAQMCALLKQARPSLKKVTLAKNLIEEGEATAMRNELRAQVPSLVVEM